MPCFGRCFHPTCVSCFLMNFACGQPNHLDDGEESMGWFWRRALYSAERSGIRSSAYPPTEYVSIFTISLARSTLRVTMLPTELLTADSLFTPFLCMHHSSRTTSNLFHWPIDVPPPPSGKHVIYLFGCPFGLCKEVQRSTKGLLSLLSFLSV